MIGQYLSQTNESATVAKTKNFPQLNKAPVQRGGLKKERARGSTGGCGARALVGSWCGFEGGDRGGEVGDGTGVASGAIKCCGGSRCRRGTTRPRSRSEDYG